MDMQISQENYTLVNFKSRLLARFSLVLSYPLTKLSPATIEIVINRLCKSKITAKETEAELARDSICMVSRKCRNQDGCVKRSLGVIAYLLLHNKKASWCTGYAMNPFRSHAWVEVNEIPIKETDDINQFERVIKTLDEPKLIQNKTIDSEPDVVDDSRTIVKFRDLLNLIEDKKKYFLLVLILGLLSSYLTLLQPNLLSDIISKEQLNIFSDKSTHSLVLLIIGSTLISSLQYYFLQKMGEQAVYSSRKKLIFHYLKLPILKYNELSTGELISRFSSDTSKLRLGIIQSTIALTSGIFLATGAMILLFIKDIILAMITISSVSISFLLIIFMSSAIQSSSYEAQKGLGRMTSYLSRIIMGIRTIRSTNETETELHKMLLEAEKVKELGVRVAKIQAIMTPLSNLGLQVCGLIVMGIGGYRVSLGSMSIGDLTSFILLLYIAVSPIGQIFSAFSSISEAMGALNRIVEITDLPLEDDNDIILRIDESINTSNAIEFNHVSFTYDTYSFKNTIDTKHYVLKDVSFDIKTGNYVSIVGPSGAGKSTILYLIERFYDISSGSIKVFGRDYRTLSREELRKNIAYVEQNSPLVAGTVLENLKLGNSHATIEQCIEVLKVCGLENLLNRDSEGLYSLIGEGGMKLSGGERQRLAMARAMLSDAKILLLDELTSNLDSLSEKSMREAIKKLRGQKTIIMVAHRLSTILDSDQIYVLEHGRLVGRGSHEELLEKVPLYRELAKEQFLV